MERALEDTRRSISKFLSIIAIAVCMEALVFIFQAGETDVRTLFYPILLLVAGVFVVIGLGIYLRITGKRNPGQSGLKEGE